MKIGMDIAQGEIDYLIKFHAKYQSQEQLLTQLLSDVFGPPCILIFSFRSLIKLILCINKFYDYFIPYPQLLI